MTDTNTATTSPAQSILDEFLGASTESMTDSALEDISAKVYRLSDDEFKEFIKLGVEQNAITFDEDDDAWDWIERIK